jgi:competence protein ComEC
VKSVLVGGRENAVRGNIRIFVPHSVEYSERFDFAAGDRVVASARVVPPNEYRNFREPFSRMYLKTQGLEAQASTKSPLLIQRTGRGKTFDPRRLVSTLRRSFQRGLETYFPAASAPAVLSPEGAVLEALILGERGRMDSATTQALQQTGLYHLFAISGAHIGIISFLVFGLLKTCRVSARASYAVVLVLLAFYALLVEGRSSVVRAVIMASAFIVGKLLWKDVHFLNTIGLSAVLILLANPFQLFDVGFQLTFAATLGIILYFPRLRTALPRLPFRVADMFGLTLAAQAAVLPFIALSFHRIIFSGLFLNLIGIPLVGLIMAVGYLFLPVSLVAPLLARPAAAGLTFLVKAFLASSHLLDGVPFLSYRIPTPPTPVILAYFVFLAALLLPPRFHRLKVAAAAGFLFALALLIIYPFPSSVRDLTVTFLDVGQGDAILVEFPGRTKMLVDGGGIPFGTFDVGENVVAPFLWNKGIKRLDVLVLTHGHPDHLYGLEAVARDFPVGEYWEESSPPADEHYDRMRRALTGARPRRLARGETLIRNGVTVEVLSPPAGFPPIAPAANDRSLVLRLSYGQTRVLLPADIGAAAEEEILAAGLPLQSQVLKAPHHGSDSSTSAAFLERVRPEIVVISVGRANPSNLPRPDVLERCRAAGAKVYRTDLQGAVEIRSDGRQISVRTSSED